MSELRFKLGDSAIYACATSGELLPYAGAECEVIDIGPWMPGIHTWRGVVYRAEYRVDYIVQFVGIGAMVGCADWQLRKLNPPAEPASLTRREEIGETA